MLQRGQRRAQNARILAHLRRRDAGTRQKKRPGEMGKLVADAAQERLPSLSYSAADEAGLEIQRVDQRSKSLSDSAAHGVDCGNSNFLPYRPLWRRFRSARACRRLLRAGRRPQTRSPTRSPPASSRPAGASSSTIAPSSGGTPSSPVTRRPSIDDAAADPGAEREERHARNASAGPETELAQSGSAAVVDGRNRKSAPLAQCRQRANDSRSSGTLAVPSTISPSSGPRMARSGDAQRFDLAARLRFHGTHAAKRSARRGRRSSPVARTRCAGAPAPAPRPPAPA